MVRYRQGGQYPGTSLYADDDFEKDGWMTLFTFRQGYINRSHQKVSPDPI